MVERGLPKKREKDETYGQNRFLSRIGRIGDLFERIGLGAHLFLGAL